MNTELHTPPRPVLLPEAPHAHRWVPGARGLREMCDYGAARFYEGFCDLVNFDCTKSEAEQIKSYMAEKHPDVAYAIGSARRTLALAVENWERNHARS